jgi:hypothetical protein
VHGQSKTRCFSVDPPDPLSGSMGLQDQVEALKQNNLDLEVRPEAKSLPSHMCRLSGGCLYIGGGIGCCDWLWLTN